MHCWYDVVDPDFVGSFVYNDKVYFFFREMALENINCGKVRCLSDLLFTIASYYGHTSLIVQSDELC